MAGVLPAALRRDSIRMDDQKDSDENSIGQAEGKKHRFCHPVLSQATITK